MGLNTDGNNNTAVGTFACRNNVSGYNNVAMGRDARNFPAAGNWDVAIGTRSQLGCSGDYNVAVGSDSLNYVNGNFNVALGHNAGAFNGVSTNNVFVGFNSQPSTIGVSNEITLGGSTHTNLRTGFNLPIVATPNNANAAAAGVPVGGFYRNNSDPYQIYQRTA